jgi:hypothetical protein
MRFNRQQRQHRYGIVQFFAPRPISMERFDSGRRCCWHYSSQPAPVTSNRVPHVHSVVRGALHFAERIPAAHNWLGSLLHRALTNLANLRHPDLFPAVHRPLRRKLISSNGHSAGRGGTWGRTSWPAFLGARPLSAAHASPARRLAQHAVVLLDDRPVALTSALLQADSIDNRNPTPAGAYEPGLLQWTQHFRDARSPHTEHQRQEFVR